MKKFREFLYRKIDWILILSGSYILSFNILNYSIKGGGQLRLLNEGGKAIHAYAYYYPNDTRLFIALSVMLIVFGILIRRDKR